MKQTGVWCFVQRQDAAITEFYFVLQSLDDVLLCLVWTIKVEVILETRQMFRLSVPNESFLPGKKQKKNKNPQQGLYSVLVWIALNFATSAFSHFFFFFFFFFFYISRVLQNRGTNERVSATGTRRIKLNLCTRVKFLQNGLKRYSPNSSYIFILRVCLEFAYFAKTKIFLLKILQIKVNVN